MDYLAIDDERFALDDLEEALRKAEPNGNIFTCTTPDRALEYVNSTPVDVAFLDIELGSMSGLLLAQKLKDLQPDINIIFVTGHEKYAVNAFQIHATGYLMKPAMEEEIQRELTFLYGETPPSKKIRIQTFGGFDVFVDGKPLIFRRSKAKELLAYLVDRRGNSVTTGMACTILWEDEANKEGKRSYFRSVVNEMKKILEEAGIRDILLKSYNSLAIVPERLDCDYYRFLAGDPKAVNSYRHDYLPAYSWAEFSISKLEDML